MEASYKNVLRSKYISTLKRIGDSLAQLRSDNVVKLSAAPQAPQPATTPDLPPDFSPLISDAQMKAILERRWVECTACVAANAPLAATVMMGGLWFVESSGRMVPPLVGAPVVRGCEVTIEGHVRSVMRSFPQSLVTPRAEAPAAPAWRACRVAWRTAWRSTCWTPRSSYRSVRCGCRPSSG